MDKSNAKSYEYGKPKAEANESEPVIEKEKPNLAVSGNLCKDTNTYNGVVIKYNEPSEARKPKKRWRMYCFKDDKELPFYPMHRQSAYLIGKDRRVADIPVDHPSCSKQHAVFQYRVVEYNRKDGSTGRTIKPYIIDLGSTNGTFVNNKQVEAQRYFELREKVRIIGCEFFHNKKTIFVGIYLTFRMLLSLDSVRGNMCCCTKRAKMIWTRAKKRMRSKMK